MLATFGSGLLVGGSSPTLVAGIAALSGAAAWVVLATRAALPVSTTHAIVGALLGVAIPAYGAGAIAWGTVGGKVVLPLLLTPLVSLALSYALLRASRGGPARPVTTVSARHWSRPSTPVA